MKNHLKSVFYNTIVSGLVVFGLTACHQGIRGTIATPPGNNPAQLLGSAYVMSPAPTNLDVVGAIFAVNSSKARYNVTTLTVPKDNGVIVVPTYQVSRKMSASALADFLGVKPEVFTANGTFNSGSSLNTTLEILSPQVERTADLIKANQAVQAIAADIQQLNAQNPTEKFKYYLIVEVIQSKSISIGLERSVADKVAVQANSPAIATKASGSVSWDKNKKYQLAYTLDTPLTVFYKVYPVLVNSALTGAVPTLGSQEITISGKSSTLYDKIVK